MTFARKARVLGVLSFGLHAGCSASSDPNESGSAPTNPAAATSSTTPSTTPSTTSSADTAGSTIPAVDVPSTPSDAPVTPGPASVQDALYTESRVRRMTVREFANTVVQLLGTSTDPSRLLGLDVPQQGYSRNQGQLVDPVFGRQLQRVAEQLAADVVSNRLSDLVPCASNPGAECAAQFIADFVPLAYRRPLGDDERAALIGLYELGAEDRPDAASRFASGIQFVLEAVLQAPSFIYISEVGELTEPGGVSALAQWEIASTLSYLMTAGPPDEALRTAAAAGELAGSEQRRIHAERLVQTAAGQEQLRTFIRQWLHLDKVATIDKSDPRFADLRVPMLQEANDFIDEVILNDDGTFAKLLTAGYTVVGPELEAFYGISTGPDGRASLEGTGRVGILQQGAFLAANSAANVSSPILRAVTILDRVTCEPPLPPSFLDVVVQQPKPDPNATTRELFAAHAADPGCAVCHQRLDGAGFPFENFGPIGEHRSEQSGKPIDTSGELISRIDADGPVVDSAELSTRLAQSADVKRCFARQLYRYAASASDSAREDTFLRGLEAEGALNDQVRALMVAFAASDSFLLRQQPRDQQSAAD